MPPPALGFVGLCAAGQALTKGEAWWMNGVTAEGQVTGCNGYATA